MHCTSVAHFDANSISRCYLPVSNYIIIFCLNNIFVWQQLCFAFTFYWLIQILDWFIKFDLYVRPRLKVSEFFAFFAFAKWPHKVHLSQQQEFSPRACWILLEHKFTLIVLKSFNVTKLFNARTRSPSHLIILSVCILSYAQHLTTLSLPTTGVWCGRGGASK